MKIIRKGDVKEIEVFPGVVGRILFSSRNMTLFYVEVKPKGVVPMHKHVQEQMGMCLEGKAEFTAGGRVEPVEPGVAYLVESDEEHGLRNLGEGEAVFLETFHPPREDYLKRFGLLNNWKKVCYRRDS